MNERPPRTLDEYLEELRSTLDILKESECDGIPGVYRIDSGIPGPTLGITACTHGDEPSGLAAIEHLLTGCEIERSLACGTLYLVANNLDAAEKFFEERALDPSQRVPRRFINWNMNRLPLDLRTQAIDASSPLELRRARQLLPVWEQFSVGLDIHSTKGDIAPMIITRGDELDTSLVRGFPMTKVLTNIDRIQIGAPVFRFMGPERSHVPVLEIESGTHTSVDSFLRAAVCAEALLKNLGMLPGERGETRNEYEVYEIFDSIVFPNDTYKLTRQFEDFEEIEIGTVFAKGRSHDIVASTPCHTVFASAPDKQKMGEEVVFLSRPMKSVPSL